VRTSKRGYLILETAPAVGQNRGPGAGISLPKNNLGAFVSVLGWNAGLVSSCPLRGAEARSP
jgi:hypothetical protein